jgi:hypothetical protein
LISVEIFEYKPKRNLKQARSYSEYPTEQAKGSFEKGELSRIK